VYRAEQDGVNREWDNRVLRRGLDEHDVAPAVLGDPLSGEVEHFRRGVNPDDCSVRPDALLHQVEAQAGAAPDVKDHVPAAQPQQLHRAAPPVVQHPRPRLVHPGVGGVRGLFPYRGNNWG
jgi:hypothetical protein